MVLSSHLSDINVNEYEKKTVRWKMQKGKRTLQKAAESNVSLMQLRILLVLIMKTLIRAQRFYKGIFNWGCFSYYISFRNKCRNKHAYKGGSRVFIHTFVIHITTSVEEMSPLNSPGINHWHPGATLCRSGTKQPCMLSRLVGNHHEQRFDFIIFYFLPSCYLKCR